MHGVDVAGAVLIRKRVSRAKVLEYFGELPRCLVGIKACPSAHHWRRWTATRSRFSKAVADFGDTIDTEWCSSFDLVTSNEEKIWSKS